MEFFLKLRKESCKWIWLLTFIFRNFDTFGSLDLFRVFFRLEFSFSKKWFVFSTWKWIFKCEWHFLIKGSRNKSWIVKILSVRFYLNLFIGFWCYLIWFLWVLIFILLYSLEEESNFGLEIISIISHVSGKSVEFSIEFFAIMAAIQTWIWGRSIIFKYRRITSTAAALRWADSLAETLASFISAAQSLAAMIYLGLSYKDI